MKIVLIYRPPRSPFSENDDNNTAKLCSALNALTGRVLVFGDFNLPGIDWARKGCTVVMLGKRWCWICFRISSGHSMWTFPPTLMATCWILSSQVMQRWYTVSVTWGCWDQVTIL